MNKDVEQVKKFIGGALRNRLPHKWQQSPDGVASEIAYIQITSYGKKDGLVKDLEELNNLLIGKFSRDMHKKMWTDGLRDGLFTVEELAEGGYEDIIFDCMKDIVKTSDRLSEFDRVQYPRSMLLAKNRNWFIDRLNIKFPSDAHYDCYNCKEAFWKTGNYVRA